MSRSSLTAWYTKRFGLRSLKVIFRCIQAIKDIDDILLCRKLKEIRIYLKTFVDDFKRHGAIKVLFTKMT